jgi:hypothetical protein
MALKNLPDSSPFDSSALSIWKININLTMPCARLLFLLCLHKGKEGKGKEGIVQKPHNGVYTTKKIRINRLLRSPPLILDDYSICVLISRLLRDTV